MSSNENVQNFRRAKLCRSLNFIHLHWPLKHTTDETWWPCPACASDLFARSARALTRRSLQRWEGPVIVQLRTCAIFPEVHVCMLARTCMNRQPCICMHECIRASGRLTLSARNGWTWRVLVASCHWTTRRERHTRHAQVSKYCRC